MRHECWYVDQIRAWYNRSLRIFADPQRTIEDLHDRVLVIYGSRHIPILRHCVMASPDYRLVEAHGYLA